MTREIAQVVYATDDTYAPHAAASIRSLIAHQDAPVSVRVLACGLAPRSKQTIRQHADVESTGASIAFIDVPLDLLKFFALEPEKENWVKHVSAATYARLYSDVFFPDLDRLLYLDADTIVLADLSELWRTDLQGRVVGAIRDPGVQTLGHAYGVQDLDRTEGSARDPYFNAGVILFDMEMARRVNLFARAREYVREVGSSMQLLDQEALNAAVAGQFYELPTMWNLMSSEPDHTELRQEVRIRHFWSDVKPWDDPSAYPDAERYHRYAVRPT